MRVDKAWSIFVCVLFMWQSSVKGLQFTFSLLLVYFVITIYSKGVCTSDKSIEWLRTCSKAHRSLYAILLPS